MSDSLQDNFKKTVERFVDQLLYVNNLSEECPNFPHYVHIEPTNACNLRCIHCIHGEGGMTRKIGMMAFSVFQKVIDEIAPMKRSVTLDVQGEPLLHPEILEMIEYCKRNGIHTSLLTNATQLSEETTERLIELKLDRIVFSFDGCTKEIYEKIRKRGKFEPTLRNIFYFIKRNYETGRHTHICMSIILQEATKDYIDEYKAYFECFPIDKIFVSPLLNMLGASSVSDEIDMDKYNQIPRADWPICRIPWENITVNSDGSVTTCPLDFDIRHPIGNVKEESLVSMWNNERIKTYRRAHLNRDYEAIEQNGVLCSNCNCLWDPEYDLRKFKDFSIQAIYRAAVHFASQLKQPEATAVDDKEKYENLLLEIQKLEDRR